jgi:biopolymer transport protein ExbD
MHRPNRMPTDHVEPDLPITPMLDMSFQLLSFFIMTFRPAPTEVQIAMALPPAEGSDPNSSVVPDILADKPTKFIVRVTAIDSGDDVGKIKNITIREEGSVLEAKDIGTSPEHYRNELKSRFNQLNGS